MSGQRIEDHYARSGSGSAIAARIIAALRAHSGADVAITPETLAAIDHLHGRGALATEELVTLLEPQPGEAILDIGSGLGGPGRRVRVIAHAHAHLHAGTVCQQPGRPGVCLRALHPLARSRRFPRPKGHDHARRRVGRHCDDGA